LEREVSAIDKLPKRYRKGVLARVNRTTTLGRELNEVFASVVEDAGGVEAMTVGSLMLAERLTFLDAMARALERQIAQDPLGQPELVGRWTQLVNALQGLVKTLRLDRSRDGSVLDALYSTPPDPQEPPPTSPRSSRGGRQGEDPTPNPSDRNAPVRPEDRGREDEDD
jgi:hypothetical protein